MKFSSTICLSLFLFSVPAISQRILIGFPADRSSAKAGSKITVEVDRPDTLSGSTEVAIVIGLNSCHNTGCIPPQDTLGSVLYNGPYNPQFHSNAPPSKPPHQNFTVKIPAEIGKGPAQLAVFHVSLIGAGLEPFTEILNTTLIIV